MQVTYRVASYPDPTSPSHDENPACTHRVLQQVVDEEGESGMPWLLLDWQSQLMLLFTQTNSTPTSGVVCKREGRGREGDERGGEKYAYLQLHAVMLSKKHKEGLTN